MNVLIITGIIPAPLTRKRRENNIILKIEDEFKRRNKDINFHYLMVIPYSNFLFSLFSRKWKEYHHLLKQKKFNFEGRTIFVIGVPGVKGDLMIKFLLNRMGFLLNRKRIETLVKSNSINLVHAQNVHTDAGLAYEIQKRFYIPYVTTCRGLETNLLSNYIRKCLLRSTFLICLNFRQKEIAEQLKKEVAIIPHGVDINYPKLPQHTETGNRVFRIITIARLLDWKNIDKVLIALKKITYNFAYDIYGEGPERERLDNLIKDFGLEGKVFLHGFKPHHVIIEILPEYDLFILLSYPETFGRVYVEALAAGVPLIGAKNTGIDGFITDGVQGLLVNHMEDSEIQNALMKLMGDENLRLEMKERASETASKFTWDSVVDQLHLVYANSKKK
jgi:glycosyltransferase involved in cell wall biosynthesis